MDKWELLKCNIRLNLAIAKDFNRNDDAQVYIRILDIMNHFEQEESE